MASATVRFLAMYGPILGVGVVSSLYLWDCVEEVLSPGTGFKLDYSTPAGPLNIACRQYNFDPIGGTLVAQDVVVRHPDGKILGRFPKLVAQGLQIGSNVAPKILLTDPSIWVRRTRGGDIDLQRYFPKSEDEPSDLAFEVDVRQGRLNLIDEASRGVPVDQLRIESAHFTGSGVDAFGSAHISLDQNRADAKLHLSTSARGTTINFDLAQSDLGALRRRLLLAPEGKQWFDLNTIAIGVGKATGTGRVMLPSRGKPSYLVDLDLKVKRAGWKQFMASDAAAKLRLSERGVRITGTAQESQTVARYDLRGVFGETFEWGGDIDFVNVQNQILTKYGLAIPKTVGFASADLRGQLVGSGDAVEFRGPMKLKNLLVSGIQIPTLNVDLGANRDRVQALFSVTKIGQSSLSGFAEYGIRNQKWRFAAESRDFSSAGLGNLVPSDLKTLHGPVSVLGSGNGTRMEVLFDGALYGSVTVAGKKLDLGGSPVRATFDGKAVNIRRATIESQQGSILASGQYDLQRGADLNLEATGINLSSLLPKLTGTGDVSGRLTGSASSPLFVGEIQLANPGLTGTKYGATALTAKIRASKTRLELSGLTAVRGTGELRGDAELDLKTGSLRGVFNADSINISDFVELPVSGIVDFNEFQLAGTLQKPQVLGSLTARSVVAKSARFSELSSRITLNDRQVTVSGLKAKFFGGRLSDGQIVYELVSKIGQIQGDVSGVQIAEVRDAIENERQSQFFGPQFRLDAQLGGKFVARVAKDEISSISATGDLSGVQVNEALLGGGTWNVNLMDRKWKGDAMVGSIDDYIQLSELTFGEKSGVVGGQVVAYNVPMRQLIQGLQPLVGDDLELKQKLNSIDGKLNVSASIDGVKDDPTINLELFEASALTLAGEKIGSVKFNGLYSSDLWSIQNGLIEGPKASKFYVPFGTISLPESKAIADGSATFAVNRRPNEVEGRFRFAGFKLNRFSPLVPALAGLGVQIDYADGSLTGTPDAPVLTARVESSVAPAGKGSGEFKTDRLAAITDLSVRAKPGSEVYELDQSTLLTYNTLEARFKARTTVPKQGGKLDAQALDGEVQLLGVQNLNPFLSRIPDLKLGERGGTATGGFKLSGTMGDPIVQGQLSLLLDRASSTAINSLIGGPVQTGLRDAQLDLSLNAQNNRVVASVRGRASTTTSTTGEVNFAGSADLSDYFSGTKPIAELWQVPINAGSLTFSQLFISQNFPDGGYVQAQFSTPEPIKLEGTIEKPRLSGELLISRLQTKIPALKPVASSNQVAKIDPTFNLSFTLSEAAWIKAATADMRLRGTGSISGPLSRLKADAALFVDSGELALPGGRVNILPDGTLDFAYRAEKDDAKAKLQADLKGTTSLTVLKNGVTPERYDVNIDIVGDMLAPSGLTLNTNEQGDLTKDRVLALLGRTDIINSFLQNGNNQQIEEDLRNALTSFSLPTFLGGITNRIAENLGFEYVSVDYNSYEQASISAARSLGNGFFLQGRRQLLPPLPGQLLAYDFRLAYRPRTGPKAFQNLSFSLGVDQILPYKFNIDYSAKVRTSNPPYRSRVWSVPPKERR